MVAFNFKKRRNIALGFALSGMGAGLFALAPLMQQARVYYGTTGFFIIQAAITLNIVAFGATYFPSGLELYTQEMRSCNSMNTMSTGNVMQRFKMVLNQYFKALNNKPIYLLSFGTFLNFGGFGIINLYLPVYVEAKGFSKTQASYMVSLTGILAVIGRLTTGAVANINKSIDIWLYSGSFAIVSIATFVFPHMSNMIGGNISYAVIFGMFSGCSYVLLPSVNRSLVTLEYTSAAIGVEIFFGGIGSLLGPEFAGKCKKYLDTNLFMLFNLFKPIEYINNVYYFK